MNKKSKTKNQTMDDYQFLIETLESWSITHYAGVTGGGVIHLLKHLKPFDITEKKEPEFLNIIEYAAGFIPLGHYLSNGQMSAAVATTGAATKLLACGLTDAKMHNIPAVYIVPISDELATGMSPLQDTSAYGIDTVEQLQAELPESVFILDDQAVLAEQFAIAKNELEKSKPVVFVLSNGVLNTKIKKLPPVPKIKPVLTDDTEIDEFIDNFRESVKGKNLVVLVGEEMIRYKDSKKLLNKFSEELRPALLWSINGANAVSRNNPYGYGYISFGGNDKALSLYESLGEDDVLMVLGACPDEYTVNVKKFTASNIFYIGGIPEAYGMVGNSMKHMAEGKYYQIISPIDKVLKKFIKASEKKPFTNKPAKPAPKDLNDKPFAKARKDYVDMAVLYKKLDEWWPKNSIGIDDVCIAYKDRQYVIQRPNENHFSYSFYRGSAMGGAFGATVGAKIASPDREVFLTTGDGCFRLFTGGMGEVCKLGIVIFVLSNQTLAIVEQGLTQVLPDVPEENYHAYLRVNDYCAIAKANGWDSERLNPDLSNLEDILNKLEKRNKNSFLVEIPVDPKQLLGSNPRLGNL